MSVKSFSHYFGELRWLAIFTIPCRMLDLLEDKDRRIRELEKELADNNDKYNAGIATLRQEFIDREIARLGFKPIYQKPEILPPPTQQRTLSGLIDQARKDLIGEIPPARTVAGRAGDLQDSLKKIQENGAASTAS